MVWISRKTRVLFPMILMLGACARLSVPDDVTGTIPVVLANNTDGNICEFKMVPRKDLGGTSENWLGMVPLDRGETLSFKLKGGFYVMHLRGCAHTFEAHAGVSLERPLELDIALAPGKGGVGKSGYELANIQVRMLPKREAAPATPAAPSENVSECNACIRRCYASAAPGTEGGCAHNCVATHDSDTCTE